MDNDQRISAPVRQAIAATQAAGVLVTLATGRMFAATRPFAQALGITAPLLCYQGGWIQAPADPAPRYRRTLPTSLALNVLRHCETQHLRVILYADGQLFFSARYPPETFDTNLLGQVCKVGEPWKSVLATHQADKVLVMAEATAIPAIGEDLRGWVAGQADVVRSHALFIEVVPSGANKGAGLDWLSAHLHIPRTAVMAVGDHENDLEMVRWAGVGVAMGNAIPAVRAAADWVAPPLEADGAAAALERFVLSGAYP